MMQAIQVQDAPMPPTPPDFGPLIVDTGPPEWIAPVAVLTLLIIVGGIVFFPLVRAWARRIEGKGGDPALLDEVQQLRDRVAELEQSAMRVHELEERVDFAERLLTQQSERARLGDGQ